MTRENVKLRLIAQRIVERRPPTPGPPRGRDCVSSGDLVNTLQELAEVLQMQRTLGATPRRQRRSIDRLRAGLRCGQHRHLRRRSAKGFFGVLSVPATWGDEVVAT
jgi:hypothetical protein